MAHGDRPTAGVAVSARAHWRFGRDARRIRVVLNTLGGENLGGGSVCTAHVSGLDGNGHLIQDVPQSGQQGVQGIWVPTAAGQAPVK